MRAGRGPAAAGVLQSLSYECNEAYITVRLQLRPVSNGRRSRSDRIFEIDPIEEFGQPILTKYAHVIRNI
jgi:hypothetical protein